MTKPNPIQASPNQLINIDWHTLQQKSEFLYTIRNFFYQKKITEITTPILSNYGNTDVFIESVAVNFRAKGQTKTGYLHTSPEFAMKKILAKHPYPIYQICQVFRDNEIGKRHNIEFTMLEWYRPHFSLWDLQQELTELLSTLYGYPIVIKNISYAQSFIDKLGIHPLDCTIATLQTLCKKHQLPTDNDRQGLLDALFSHIIEPMLGQDLPTIVSDYPTQTAALSNTKQDKDGFEVACRFELYIHGLEIANAYDELASSATLHARFCHDNATRQHKALPIMSIDHDLIHACDTLPPCSGIAVGLDRLFMAIHNLSDISDVICLTSDKA